MMRAAESPEIQQIRDALPGVDAIREQDQATRKELAVTAVEQVLDAIDAGLWPLSDWELYCLSSAIVAIRTGYYSLAYVDVVLALEPHDMRPANPSTPAIEVFERSVPGLRRELEAAAAWPVRDVSGDGSPAARSARRP